MPENGHTRTWPELAIGLYDRLTGRGASISYEFDKMHVKIPSGAGADATHADWVFSGALTIRTSDQG